MKVREAGSLTGRGRRLKILFFCPAVPYPADSGLKLRVFNLARELARRHEVHLFCLSRAPADPESLSAIEETGINVTVLVKPRLSLTEKAAAYLSRLARGVPLPYILSWEKPITLGLARLEAAVRFDVIVAEHLFMARFVTGSRTVKVITEHNVEGKLEAQLARVQPAPLRWLKKVKAAWITLYERNMLRRFAAVVAVSEPDRETLQKMAPAVPVTTVGNGVDCARYAALFDKLPASGQRLLFLGLLNYPPNIEAAAWFSREVMPLVRDGFPEAVLTIAGAEPTARILALDNGVSVRVAGPVADVRPSYQESTLMVVPLLKGGGSRLKILEAFAAGTPVVSTSKGAEGLLVEDGTHLLIADGAREFAVAIARLLEDKKLYASLRQNARQLVEEHYDWPVPAAQLEQVLLMAVAR